MNPYSRFSSTRQDLPQIRFRISLFHRTFVGLVFGQNGERSELQNYQNFIALYFLCHILEMLFHSFLGCFECFPHTTKGIFYTSLYKQYKMLYNHLCRHTLLLLLSWSYNLYIQYVSYIHTTYILFIVYTIYIIYIIYIIHILYSIYSICNILQYIIYYTYTINLLYIYYILYIGSQYILQGKYMLKVYVNGSRLYRQILGLILVYGQGIGLIPVWASYLENP